MMPISNKIDSNIKAVANSLDKLSTKIQELDFPENHDLGKLIGDFGNSLVTFTDSAGDSIREIYSTISSGLKPKKEAFAKSAKKIWNWINPWD